MSQSDAAYYQGRAAAGALQADRAEAKGDHESADYYRDYQDRYASHALEFEQADD